jgi:hypothetical protein
MPWPLTKDICCLTATSATSLLFKVDWVERFQDVAMVAFPPSVLKHLPFFSFYLFFKDNSGKDVKILPFNSCSTLFSIRKPQHKYIYSAIPMPSRIKVGMKTIYKVKRHTTEAQALKKTKKTTLEKLQSLTDSNYLSSPNTLCFTGYANPLVRNDNGIYKLLKWSQLLSVN